MAAVYTVNVTYLANGKVEELASFGTLIEAEQRMRQMLAQAERLDVLVGGNANEFETFSERYFIGSRSLQKAA